MQLKPACYGAFGNWATTSESVDRCNVGAVQKCFCCLFSHLRGWVWSTALSGIERANRGNSCASAKTAQFDSPFHPGRCDVTMKNAVCLIGEW